MSESLSKGIMDNCLLHVDFAISKTDFFFLIWNSDKAPFPSCTVKRMIIAIDQSN